MPANDVHVPEMPYSIQAQIAPHLFSDLIITLHLHTHTGSNHQNKIFMNTAEQAVCPFTGFKKRDRARGCWLIYIYIHFPHHVFY